MTIREKIQTEFIGTNYQGEEKTNEILTKIVGHPSNMYDNCIDDGVDEDESEDSYVMKACFSFFGIDIKVRIYYGDVTEEIGYVDVSGNDANVEVGGLKKIARFHIPNFDNLEKEVIEFVKENQGEKGFINTSCGNNDTIWAFIYSDSMCCGVETQVMGVRVRNEELEVALERDFVSWEWEDETKYNEVPWYGVSTSDIYRVHTLVSIAESIGEYVGE